MKFRNLRSSPRLPSKSKSSRSKSNFDDFDDFDDSDYVVLDGVCDCGVPIAFSYVGDCVAISFDVPYSPLSAYKLTLNEYRVLTLFRLELPVRIDPLISVGIRCTLRILNSPIKPPEFSPSDLIYFYSLKETLQKVETEIFNKNISVETISEIQ